jgi:antitoxin HigA-1
MAKASAIRMHKPPHPGEVLRDGVFTDSAISVTDFAKRLGVTRALLSRLLKGEASVSAEIAVRLAAALGGTAQSWLHMQANYDLWQAEKALKREVKKIKPIQRSANRVDVEVSDDGNDDGGYSIHLEPLLKRAMKNDPRAAAELWRFFAGLSERDWGYCNFNDTYRWMNFVAKRVVAEVLDKDISANRAAEAARGAIGLAGRAKTDKLEAFVKDHDWALEGFKTLDDDGNPVPDEPKSNPYRDAMNLATYVIAQGIVGSSIKAETIAKRIERIRKK